MHMRDVIVLFCSGAALLLLAALPTGILLTGMRFFRPNTGEPQFAATPRLTFWKKQLLGALGGVIAGAIAIAVYGPAQSTWCHEMSMQGSHCDGQGPLILVFSVPACVVVGSFISTLWTWYSLGIPASRLYASVFRYDGQNRTANVATAIGFQVVYWILFALAVYRVTLAALLP